MKPLSRRPAPWAVVCLAFALTAAAGCNSKTPSTADGTAIPAAGAFKHDNDDPYDGPAWFEDVTAAAGVYFTYRNDEAAGHFAIIESLGGGVALFDFDRDGMLDIYLTGGGHYPGKTVLGHPGRLYRNKGDLRFEDVTAAAGLDRPAQFSHGVAVADINRDGFSDLLVTGYDRLALYMNEPGGPHGRRFVDATEKAK